MKNVVVMSTLMMILPVAGSVGAQEKADGSSEAVWSIGAGVGFGSYYPSGMSGLSTLSCLSDDYCYSTYGFSSLPSAQFVLERKFSPSSYVMMKLTGALENRDDKNRYGDRESLEGKELGAVLGYRWVLNPAGVVTVSPTFAISGHWGWYNFERQPDLDHAIIEKVSEAYAYSVSAVVGIVLERELLENLFLRLETSLLQATYSWTETKRYHDGEYRPGSTSNRTSAGLAFNPSLQLRLQF